MDLVCGHRGRVGGALFRALPEALGIDLADHDLRQPHGWHNWFKGVRRVYCAAGQHNPTAPAIEHAESLQIVANVIWMALDWNVEEVWLSSSSWAAESFDDGRPVNDATRAYSASKRAIEAMAKVDSRIRTVRIGYFPGDETCPDDVPDYCRAMFWSPARLLKEFNVKD